MPGPMNLGSAAKAVAFARSTWNEGLEAQKRSDGKEIQVFRKLNPSLDGESTYRNAYRGWDGMPGRREAFRPARVPADDSPFAGKSSYMDHYRAWPLPPRARTAKVGWQREEEDRPFTTTHEDAFKDFGWQRMPICRPAQNSISGGGMGDVRSTYAASYVPHQVPKPKIVNPPRRPLDNAIFSGQSTYSDHFKGPPDGFRPATSMKDKNPNYKKTPFEGQSNHNESYQRIVLPEGADHDLGLQIVGGKFHLMLKRGSRAPCTAKATFTTVKDQQRVVEVVIIARKRGEPALELGHFQIGGIRPGPPGEARITCTFQLQPGLTLRVKASDELNSHGTRVWMTPVPH